jgi:hypothetical protein
VGGVLNTSTPVVNPGGSVKQWVPVNGITDNGINQLMGRNLSQLTNLRLISLFAYYNRLVVVISFSLSHSDHIKPLQRQERRVRQVIQIR